MQLHREDVLNGALALLDADGLDALTVRKLAGRLGVQPGALYWHFKTKQSLMDAMADRMLGGVADPRPSGTWAQQLETLAQRYRTALLRHRDGARVVAGSYVAQPHTLSTGQAFVGALTAGGMTGEYAGWTWSAIKYYILGHCIEEQAREALQRDGEWETKGAQIEDLDVQPDPATAAALHAVLTGDPARQFAHGLTLLITGIAETLRQPPRP